MIWMRHGAGLIRVEAGMWGRKDKAPYSNEFPSAKFQVLAIGVFRK
jgi:hypothetical protein